MEEIEINEEMYYACKCKKPSIQWHTPGTKIWNRHIEQIDLDETNSNRPKYFWCTRHKTPHAFKRDCLEYRAVITYKGNKGIINSQTSELSHNDVLPEIDKYVLQNSNALNWRKAVRNSNSLPWPCDRNTRLREPDLIYVEPNRTLMTKYSITNIVEFETKTQKEAIFEKTKDYNSASKYMIENNTQSKVNLPRIIFLYDKQANISITEINQMIKMSTFEYIDGIFIDYYDEKGEWFKQYFKM